jgi:hypothetical protein
MVRTRTVSVYSGRFDECVIRRLDPPIHLLTPSDNPLRLPQNRRPGPSTPMASASGPIVFVTAISAGDHGCDGGSSLLGSEARRRASRAAPKSGFLDIIVLLEGGGTLALQAARRSMTMPASRDGSRRARSSRSASTLPSGRGQERARQMGARRRSVGRAVGVCRRRHERPAGIERASRQIHIKFARSSRAGLTTPRSDAGPASGGLALRSVLTRRPARRKFQDHG